VRHASIGFHHQGTVLRDELRREQRGVPRERTDDELAAADPDVREAGHAVDVDENRGLHEPQVHHRHQALSTGKNPAGRRVARERFERLRERTRPDVLERCWFHMHLLWVKVIPGSGRLPLAAPAGVARSCPGGWSAGRRTQLLE